jgi:hypothetical protein
VALATALVPALIDQARFKPDQLALALDETHASRYLIGPRRDGKRYTIASGLLGVFGGFVSRSFRDFDFQLGRRNCQQFLRTSFAVGAGNKIVETWGLKVDRARFKTPPDPKDAVTGTTYCLIPLYGSATAEVPLPTWPQISQDDFDLLEKRIAERFDRVAPMLITQSLGGFLGILFKIALNPGFSFALNLIRDKVLHYIKLTILSDLVRRDQIEGWDMPIDTALSSGDLRLAVAELLTPRYELRNAAGIYKAIQSIATPNLTAQAIEAALNHLKGSTGKPYQVWEAGWKDKTHTGDDVNLYTLVSRKPWWADGLTGGRFLAGLFQPGADTPDNVVNLTSAD